MEPAIQQVRLITYSEFGQAVYPEFGHGIDWELAKSIAIAFNAGEFTARPLGKRVSKVTIEYSDGSILVVWRRGDNIMGVYAEPSRHVIQAQQAPQQ